LNFDQIRAVEKRRDQYADRSGKEIEISELEYKVRRIIGDYVVSPKNEYKLNRWLESSKDFKKDLSAQAIARNSHELSRIFELENIIKCADLSATAALARKESRWGDSHIRCDFPERDDENWLKHVIVSKDSDDSSIAVSYKPVIGS